MIKALKAGRNLSLLRPNLRRRIKPPGICSRWGCASPVGPRSQWGFGPVCDVCHHGLRERGSQ